jgi:hypothetical protein
VHVVFITGHASHPAPMYFGASLAVGDFNGDGFSDLAVGAPDYRPKHQHGGFENNPETQGAVFEYLGSATGLHQQPLSLVGPYDGDDPFNLGGALATGDADRDGFTDLAVTLFGGDNGDIRFYHGSASGLTQTGEQDLDDSFAAALDFGDVNGDGHPDLIAGSDTDFSNSHDLFYGDVKVFNGTSLGVHTNPAVSIDGQQVGVRFGLAYSSLATGDINGDGFEDVVGGNPIDRQHGTHKLAGSVIVLYGSQHGLRAIHSERIQAAQIYSPTQPSDQFGFAVAVADVNGDGHADVAIGAPGKDVSGVVNAGAVYVLRGTAHGLSTAHPQRFTLSSPGVPGAAHHNGQFGSALYLAQYAGSAARDLVVGASGESQGALHGGYAVRLNGTSHGLTSHHAHGVVDPQAGDHLGVSVR